MPFQWSEQSQRYRDEATGRFVSTAAVNRAVDTVIAGAAANMQQLSTNLQLGQITLAQWQTGMAQEMKLLHVGAAAVGRGGWAQMSQSDWGWTGQRLRMQYGFLNNFAHDIATGKQKMNGTLLTRTTMYAEAARATQREMQRRTAQNAGRVQERNVLGAAEHCPGCVDCTARGWVPIGSLPPVGSRQCRSRCHCSIQTRSHVAMMAAA